MDDILHLTDLKMPAGVEVFALRQGEEYDSAVASIHARKVAAETEEGAEEAGEAAAPEEGEEGGESES
jgi:large subunit ribosomal protein L25